MGDKETLTPDQRYDTTGTIDQLSLVQLGQLEVQAAVEDAEDLLADQELGDADHG